MFIRISKPKQGESCSGAEPAELWSGIRGGDKQALSGLFCLYYSPLLSYGCNMIARPGVVKDAIQELFLTLWEKRSSISEAHSVKSYLFYSLRRIILRNLTRQKNRKNRNEVYTTTFQEELFNVEELMVHFETKREQKRKLVQALDTLSKRQKEAIFLKFYEGLSNSEIACVMDIRQQSVYNHVSEAIGHLQEFVQVRERQDDRLTAIG